MKTELLVKRPSSPCEIIESVPRAVLMNRFQDAIFFYEMFGHAHEIFSDDYCMLFINNSNIVTYYLRYCGTEQELTYFIPIHTRGQYELRNGRVKLSPDAKDIQSILADKKNPHSAIAEYDDNGVIQSVIITNAVMCENILR